MREDWAGGRACILPFLRACAFWHLGPARGPIGSTQYEAGRVSALLLSSVCPLVWDGGFAVKSGRLAGLYSLAKFALWQGGLALAAASSESFCLALLSALILGNERLCRAPCYSSSCSADGLW